IVPRAKTRLVGPRRPLFEPRRHGHAWPSEDDLPFDFRPDALEIPAEVCGRGTIRRVQLERRRRHRAPRARRPGEDLHSQLIFDGRDHVGRDVFVLPAWMPELPRLEMTVIKPPAGHGFHYPFAGGLRVR